MPPPLRPWVGALLAHERITVAEPEVVRARVLARARRALGEAPGATPPRLAPTGARRPLFAAAAVIALMAGAAAAFQMIRRAAPTTPPPSSAPAPEIAPPPAPPDRSAQARPAPVGSGQETGEAKAGAPVDGTPAATAAGVEVRGGRAVLAGKRDAGPDELALLSRARQLDARGEYADVLAIVAEHERSHPAGRLAEEREVLRVKALVGLGRGGEARSAAARFHRQFPRSVLLRKVDEMLVASP